MRGAARIVSPADTALLLLLGAAALWLSSPVFGQAPPPRVLIVPPGAERVEQQAFPTGDESVRFEVQMAFPATSLIDRVFERFRKLGWQPLKEDSQNLGIPTSYIRGWTSFIDSTKHPSVQRYVWSSEWKGPKGEIASYGLAYGFPDPKGAPLSRLEVHGSLMTASVAEAVQKQVERRKGSQRPPSVDRFDTASATTAFAVGPGDVVLASNHLGEALIEAPVRNSYRWRFRDGSTGAETRGKSPLSGSLRAGSFGLQWMPECQVAPDPGASCVGFHAKAEDVLVLPGRFFQSLDLGEIHHLATLAPDRNQEYARYRPEPDQVVDERKMAFLESGQSLLIHEGQAVLISGVNGRAVVRVEPSRLDSVKYSWRFRAAKSGSLETTGSQEAAGAPIQLLHVNGYELGWETVSTTKKSDSSGTRLTEWIARVRYFPAEMTLEVVPQDRFTQIDLSPVSPTQRQ